MTLFVCASVWVCECVSVWVSTAEREEESEPGWINEWTRSYEDSFYSLKKSIDHYVVIGVGVVVSF